MACIEARGLRKNFGSTSRWMELIFASKRAAFSDSSARMAQVRQRR